MENVENNTLTEEVQPKNKMKRWKATGKLIVKHYYDGTIYAPDEDEAYGQARGGMAEELEDHGIFSDPWMAVTDADFTISEVVDKAFSVSFPTDEPSENSCWRDGNRVFALGADEDEARQRIERHIRDAIEEVRDTEQGGAQ